MTSSSIKPGVCLGFLTVVENAELGYIGGYLLLNALGRPLEFHCTAPVKPNHTQEILYGTTLKPYLYGEVIGQSLITKSKLRPLVVCTDCEPVLAAREFAQIPLVFVLEEQGDRESLAKTDWGSGTTSIAKDSRPLFSLGKSRVVAASRYSSDAETICAAWPAQADQLDLLEPFSRIHEALDEAQQAIRQAA